MPIMVIVAALGAPLGGCLLDAGLSYTVFFWVVALAVTVTGLASFFMKPPKVVRQASPPAAAGVTSVS